MAWNNEIRLIGRLSKDPSIYNSAVKFDIAVNRGKSKDGADLGADFVSCTTFGRQMEVVKNLHKGDEVYVEGTLKLDNYKKNDGSTGYSTGVIVNIVKQFALRTTQPSYQAPTYQQPNTQTYQPSYQAPTYQAPSTFNVSIPDDDDDMPF